MPRSNPLPLPTVAAADRAGQTERGLSALESFQLWHVPRWQGCTACDCHHGRQRVVFGRGALPCDVFLCGEAPGVSEDVLGRPFVGPAGRLFDQIVAQALPAAWGLRTCYGNVLACIPTDATGAKAVEPSEEEIRACAPRFRELLTLAAPRLLVCVGCVAWDWTDPDDRDCLLPLELRDVLRCQILHPAAILRAPYAARGMQVRRAVVTIYNEARRLVPDAT